MTRVLALGLTFLLAVAPARADGIVEEDTFKTDTVVVGRSAVLTNVKGDVSKKQPDGSLSRVYEGDEIWPGDVLLAREGASFAIENITLVYPLTRWVRIR